MPATYNVGTSMSPGRIACALAVVAVLSVLSIFFFPSLQGPYSVVHGPVSALLSLRAATMVRNAMTRAGQSVRQGCKHMVALVPGWVAKGIFAIEVSADVPSASGAILRC